MENNKNVIFDNHVNNIRLKGFNKKDLDLFMVVCKHFMDKNTYEVKIPYSTIKELVNYRAMSAKDFHETIKNLDKKFYNLRIVFDDGDNYDSAVFITRYSANKQKRILTIKINPEFVNFFNVFNSYTKVDLLIHISLQSKYSATLYRILCQYNKNKWWQVDIQEFISIFDLSDYYAKNKKMIPTDIIEPAIKELKQYMSITYNVIRDAHKRGRPVIAYRFEYSTKPKIEQKSTEKTVKTEENTNNDTSLLDEIIDLLDNANLNIGTKSTMSCAQKAVELNRSVEYIQDVINIVKSQNNDNTAGKLMYLIVNGYDTPKSSKKKNKFNNFEQRSNIAGIEMNDLEKLLLE